MPRGRKRRKQRGERRTPQSKQRGRSFARCSPCLGHAARPSTRAGSTQSPSCLPRRHGGRGRRGRSDVFLAFLFMVADVPVIIQLLFQQSKVYVHMTVSQIQVIGRVLDIPFMSQRQVRTVLLCRSLETPQVQCLGKVVDAPAVVPRPVPAGWSGHCSSTTAVACSWLVLLVIRISCCVLFVCRQDRGVTHHGRLGRRQRSLMAEFR